ncbi:sigma-70 family RNA polymerase sigma factor [Paenibacillus larvae]|uniref:RNA polymerase sigma factor n=1 Tax=Paenibacillus larvae TaxID=1464 RepID=UPI00228194F0|nr:sigma-70 family RNA polymerase sigma factor [Paenibacillus larvae]MCY9510442.1 sigma-70 family RNA polymerase sigma factor [Paenibacillus larvae]MCY9526670.1 sigma-70 family RNA polymerase sigma factor [Paenibacillus larvae]
MEQLTDEEWVEQIRQGHAEAYRYLVERHKNYVYTLIYRMVGHRETAEDLSQEVFLKAYRSLAQYRGEAKFTTWLYRLTTNLVTDYLRARKRRPMEVWADKVKNWFVSPDPDKGPEEQVILNEQRDALHEALLKLPEKYRIVLSLYHFQQFSYQEISDILQVPVKTVETRLYRGKSMLKQKWLEVDPDAKQASELKKTASFKS